MTRLLQRVVFPQHPDPAVQPLYADDDVRPTGRTSAELAPGASGSLGTYFSAIAVGYWRHWCRLDRVVLRGTATGSGEVVVLRSDALGVGREVGRVNVTGSVSIEFPVDIADADAGGWAWVELHAGDRLLTVDGLGWWSDADADAGEVVTDVGSVSIAITTLDRNDYCLEVLRSLGSDQVVLETIHRIHVIDQGRRRISDADGFAEVADVLGDRLNLVEQPNLGGSGGFSRGMLETLREGASRYVLILDDDVRLEPESVRRLVAFADAQGGDAIVGAHMLDIGAPTVLHAFAEGIDQNDFFWRARSPERHDLASAALRDTAWMHRRHDADYTGWWMCLIPVEVIREIGLSAPFFIKWDDAEFSLRAAESGHATISLPGAALWHVAWLDKGDSRDWQAFYHTRNRILSALLHSGSAHGGGLLSDALQLDLRDLVTHRYSVAEMRIDAYRSVLAGVGSLHRELPTRRGEIVSSLRGWRDAGVWTGDEPPSRRSASPRREPPHGVRLAIWLIRVLARDLLTPSPRRTATAVRYDIRDARWWEVGRHDSVLVDAPDGIHWYLRDRRSFLRLLIEGARLRRRIRREWSRLRDAARRDFPAEVSVERWAETVARADRGGRA